MKYKERCAISLSIFSFLFLISAALHVINYVYTLAHTVHLNPLTPVFFLCSFAVMFVAYYATVAIACNLLIFKKNEEK